MSEYIKLAEAPTLVYQSPQCSMCCVDLESEDGWICPVCGSTWGYDDSDGDTGELYESWSGEELESDPVAESEAWQIGARFERARVARIMAKYATKREGDAS